MEVTPVIVKYRIHWRDHTCALELFGVMMQSCTCIRKVPRFNLDCVGWDFHDLHQSFQIMFQIVCLLWNRWGPLPSNIALIFLICLSGVFIEFSYQVAWKRRTILQETLMLFTAKLYNLSFLISLLQCSAAFPTVILSVLCKRYITVWTLSPYFNDKLVENIEVCFLLLRSHIKNRNHRELY